MSEKPNWKKGDIISLINRYGGVSSIFEANQDPWYGKPFFSSKEDWYYGLRHCEEIRLATIEDIDSKIQYQKENVEREQLRLDELFNFRVVTILEK
jgi:hypothetical protein